MSDQANATFEIKAWDEKPYDEAEGMGKLTRVRAVYSYHGDIEGEGVWEALMTYQDGGTTAYFVSLERIIGSIGGKSGTFVVQGQGTYTEQEGAKNEFSVVPGSGTNELKGLGGKGEYVAKQPPFSIKLAYYFE